MGILFASYVLGKLADPVLWILAAGSFFAVRSWWNIPIAAALAVIAQIVAYKAFGPARVPADAGVSVGAAALAGAVACAVCYGVRRIYRAGVERDAVD